MSCLDPLPCIQGDDEEDQQHYDDEGTYPHDLGGLPNPVIQILVPLGGVLEEVPPPPFPLNPPANVLAAGTTRGVPESLTKVPWLHLICAPARGTAEALRTALSASTFLQDGYRVEPLVPASRFGYHARKEVGWCWVTTRGASW